MEKILITVPHGCSKRNKSLCDIYANDVGSKIASGLAAEGFLVKYLQSTAIREIVDSSSKEALPGKTPSGSDIKKRVAAINQQLKQPMSFSIAVTEIAKATKFREDIREISKCVVKPDIHIDFHSFNCKRDDCNDIVILDIPFYSKDNLMAKKLVENIKKQTDLSVDKVLGSRSSNNLIVDASIANSAVIEISESTTKRISPEIMSEKLLPAISNTIKGLVGFHPNRNREKFLERKKKEAKLAAIGKKKVDTSCIDDW